MPGITQKSAHQCEEEENARPRSEGKRQGGKDPPWQVHWVHASRQKNASCGRNWTWVSRVIKLASIRLHRTVYHKTWMRNLAGDSRHIKPLLCGQNKRMRKLEGHLMVMAWECNCADLMWFRKFHHLLSCLWVSVNLRESPWESMFAAQSSTTEERSACFFKMLWMLVNRYDTVLAVTPALLRSNC